MAKPTVYGGLFVFPWIWGMFLLVAAGDPAYFTHLMVFCVVLDFLKSNASDDHLAKTDAEVDNGKVPTASVDKTEAENLVTGLSFEPEEIRPILDDSNGDDAKPDSLAVADDWIPEAKQDTGSMPKPVGSPVKQLRLRPARHPGTEWTPVEYFKVQEGRDHLKRAGIRKAKPVGELLKQLGLHHAQHLDTTEPAVGSTVEKMCLPPAKQLDTSEPAPKNISVKLSGLKRKGVKLLQRMKMKKLCD